MLGVDEGEKCRVTFNEITKDAVRAAVKNPTVVDQRLVDAQQARRVLDRLVGYSISPLLWRKLRKGLSAGRVQSVATKIICDRENEIKAFIPEEYWSISAPMKNASGAGFEANYHGFDNKKAELKSKEDVDKIISELNSDYTIKSIDKKEKKRVPYPAFTTSSLQQEAANRLGFSTKKTMMLAQQLYEGISITGNGTVGLITYMRTDSTRISDDAKGKLKDFITANYAPEFLNTTERKAKKVKAAQDAHEAIRPTNVEYTPESIIGSLSKDQYKLYKLIWERLVATGMSDAKYQMASIKIENNGHLFKANGNVLTFKGFLEVYSYTSVKENSLPELSENEKLICEKLDPKQHFTQPPARFTEASLVKEMEENGIGRPSTYAPTISTIISRGYVERDKKSLLPTELGYIINEIIETYFTKIVEVDFTAGMEMKFDEVEDGEKEWKVIIEEFYTGFDEMIKIADEALEKVDLTEETDIDCEKCGHKMNIKHGKFGKFLACSNYPECKNTKPILKEIGVDCPLCETGQVVERKTKKFKTFYGCNTFPDCGFVSWGRPINRFCPECDSILVEHKTKKKNEIKCSSKTCSYKEEIKE